MSDTVQVALIGLTGTILTIIVVPLAAWAWSQWKARDAAMREQGREKERAEAYKREATAAIDQKNAELADEQAENEELRSWIFRLTDNDIPRLQRKIDKQEATIATFADAYKKLADQKAVES